MKRLVKKLFLSVLLQCLFVFSYLQIMLLYKFYVWKIDWWIIWVVFLLLNILIQRIVYKIYKKKPLENEKYKDAYMWVNGLFIVLEAGLLLMAI
ncbi:MAG: hypothetical protein J6D02_00560 [Lachnospira sp.]|nr:hypothetical protein [Lachnospira sp.]